MKKFLFLPLMLLSLVFASCSMDELEEPMTAKQANATVLFNIAQAPADSAQAPATRAASVGDKWPNTTTKDNAETVVSDVYTTPLHQGLSFFTTNYSVNLTNDKGGSITEWNGSTTISLTSVNNLTVTLTENTEGAFPKFETAKGSIDLSNVDIDTDGKIDASKAVCTGDISVSQITVTDGKVNVTITVSLTYDSYLLVAPDADWTILTNVKGFKALHWGGSTGPKFNEYSIKDGDWYYYWGHGNDYVWGAGTILSYGFNLYADGSDDIKVENGKWYCLFASLSSVGEGDDNPTSDSTDDDKTKEHTVGGANGITPTANDIVSGGAIR